MLNISFLACTKVKLWDLYCGKWRKISKTPHDLDLGPAMPNIKLVRDIFIYYDVLKFCIHRSITFFSYRAKTQKRGNTETHTDSDEYSSVAFCNFNYQGGPTFETYCITLFLSGH